MTIEIRELVIRAVAEARRPDPAGPTPHAAAESRPASAVDDELVARCVREVLRELRRSWAR